MNLRREFYIQPMDQVYIETIAIYGIWTVAMLILRGKARRIVAGAGALCAVALILMYTLIGRSSGEGQALSLIPFVSFVKALTQSEFYRTMYMNMLLFMPLGLSLPFVLPDRVKHKALFTILIGTAFSINIEAIQFFFRIGKCETDDVIMNALGVLIGITSYLICILVEKKMKVK